MQSVVQGKLLYLKMVKGADSEVWRRLQRRFNKLSGAKPSTESATIKYRYTIADFEKKIGQKLQIETKDGVIKRCYFTLNDQSTTVTLSRYARTRITNILAKSDLAQLEKFKTSYILIFYEQNNTGFWRIERKRTWTKLPSLEDLDAEALIKEFFAVTTAPFAASDSAATPGKTADEVLAALIDSDFDLNILDEWDKIKSS